MGVIKRGILGGFSGKVAGLVGTSWKGIAVIKALPLSVANPKTAAQVANREQFKAAGQLGSILLIDIVKPLWDRDAQRQSGYNAFLSANKDAFSSVGVLDVTKLVPTLGKLPETDMVNFLVPIGDTEVTFDFSTGAGGDEALPTDKAFVVIYNATKNEWATDDGSVTRQTGSAVVAFPSAMEVDDIISAWLMFQGVSAAKRKYKASSDLSNTVQ